MNYWHILDEARRALEEGRFRDAEQAHDRAHAVRDADGRRVLVSEKLPDGLRRAWRRIVRAPGDDGPGRWDQAVGAFVAAYRTAAEARLQQAARRLDLGTRDEPEASCDLLQDALYLAVGGRLCERRLPVSPLLVGLFELLPLTGRLGDRDLVTGDLDLDAVTRLHLAQLARDHLGRLPADERPGWAAAVLALLDVPEFAWSPAQDGDRRWLAAGIADLHDDDVPGILQRWADVDRDPLPEGRRHWSRLRRLELLGGCDPRRLAVPRHDEARRLAADLPREGDEEVPRRLRAALALLSHRRPGEDPSRGWISAGAEPDGVIHAVYWWGAEPRDLAAWRPGDDPGPWQRFLAAARGRVVWQTDVPAPAEGEPAMPGRSLASYLEAVLEPLLPEAGWSVDLARRLALARSGPWRDGWRADLGLAALQPPGQDGHLAPEQEALEPALLTGLLWLAVVARVNEADPALRAGLGELGRRGDAAAAFLHDAAVLGAPDKAAVDAGFQAWTLPLLWTRPDPLTVTGASEPGAEGHEDLAGQDVAVVTTGRPGPALAAWGPGSRRWRVVLDRIDRLGLLRRQAREAYGPVTVVPPAGEVHHLGSSLRWLEELTTADGDEWGGMLAVCHWIRLVESHNGDLLDFRVWRPRSTGTCPLHDRYAELLADLPRQPVPAADQPQDGGWGDQYAQRVRRSGLVAGLVEDLPDRAEPLDAMWGVYNGSEASWVFLDAAAAHWRLEARGPGAATRQHELLAPRGARHLSVLGGRGLFPDDLAGWFDEVLAAYGRPYHLALGDAAPPRLRLAGSGPLPSACLDPAGAWAAPLGALQGAAVDTAVLVPSHGVAADFWRAAAAGTFGPVAWRPVAHDEPVSAARLVVPRLESLAPLSAGLRPAGDDPRQWAQVDAQRRRVRLAARRRVALECGALLAQPVAALEILDVRWWRQLADPDLDPAAAAVWAGVPEAELIDLGPACGGAQPPATAEWARDHEPVPGLLPDWPGLPLADARPVTAGGVQLHAGGVTALWRDLVADLLRSWENGAPVHRLLVVAQQPPPGAAVVSARLAAAGTSVPDVERDEALAPLAWLRPGDLRDLLQSGDRLPTAERILVLGADDLLPAEGGQGVAGARLLGWLASAGAERLDLVTGHLSEPWRRYLAAVLGAQVPAPTGGPWGWSSLRRAAGPRRDRCCPQCGHQAAGAVDGTVCDRCGQDLAASPPAAATSAAGHQRARQILGQADLGREAPLEIWDTPGELALVEAEARALGARPDPERPDLWILPDDRRWRLRMLAPAARADGEALVLTVPDDPERLRPRAPETGAAALTLLYDRCDLAVVAGCGADGEAERLARLLALLADPRWLEPAASGATPGLQPQIPHRRLAWLAGLDEGEVRRQLDLLLWAGVLAGDLPLAENETDNAAAVRLQIHVPVRDMELALAGLAAEIEGTLDSLLAGGLPGAWQELTALGNDRDPDADGAPQRPARLDVVLAQAATWPLAGGGRLGYLAPDGAWFSRRRRVTWFGDRTRLARDLVHELDGFAAWLRERLEGESRVERGFVVTLPAEPQASALARRLLLGQELGFWTRGGPAGGEYRSRGELERLLGAPVLAGDGPAVALLHGLAAARDHWRQRLAATPPGGEVTDTAGGPDTGVTPTSSRAWWRREGKDPLLGARRKVRELAASVEPGRLALVGPFGSGRTDALLSGLAATAAGRAAPIWCPDRATAARLHLAARRFDPVWQPRLQVWGPEQALPPRDGGAPGEHRLLTVAELQRFPREVGYQLQEAGREGRVVMTVDLEEVTGAREDLFLTTPRRDEILELRVQVMQAQQPWRVTRPLLAVASTETRGRRRDRGQVVSRKAGTLDECASAVAAAAGSGRIGELVLLTAPLDEDVQLLARALADRRWAAVTCDDLEGWLLPGAMELAAALADAHRRRHGAWPGPAAADDAAVRTGTLLGSFLPDGAAEDWAAWLRTLPDAVLDDAGAFLDRLRRSPWAAACCMRPTARQRLVALREGAAGRPCGDLLTPAVWQAWRRTLAGALDRADLAAGPPAVVLASAASGGGLPCESAVYVCFGPEPAAVHRCVLSRATDRILVLYQEHSPLPGENESTAP